MKQGSKNKLAFHKAAVVELDTNLLIDINGGTSWTDLYIHDNGDVYVGQDTKTSDKVN